MATEPLLGAVRARGMFHYNSSSETAKLVAEEGTVNMAAKLEDGRGLGESQATSSMEESLRHRSTSSPASTDDFFRVEVKWREGRGTGRLCSFVWVLNAVVRVVW